MEFLQALSGLLSEHVVAGIVCRTCSRDEVVSKLLERLARMAWLAGAVLKLMDRAIDVALL